MNELTHLLYKGEKLYLCSHVSLYLKKNSDYLSTMIWNKKLEENKHYLSLEKDEVENLLRENESFLWGRGHLKYFITEEGVSYLESTVLNNYSRILNRPVNSNNIQLKTGKGPLIIEDERQMIINDLKELISKTQDKKIAQKLMKAISFIKKA